VSAPEPTMSDHARIAQTSVSAGGAPQRLVPAARVTALEGDARRNQEFHGGPERALDLYSLERIQAEGCLISPGSVGESLTLEGIDCSAVAQGACLRLGWDVVVQIIRYTAPCSNIASFKHSDYAHVSQKPHPGDSRVYVRVVRESRLATGNPLRILPADEAAGLVSA
jgi:MOSC domain-containing protein YiiM